MSSSRESLSALDRRRAEAEVRRSEEGRGALGMSRRHLNQTAAEARLTSACQNAFKRSDTLISL